MKIRHLLTCLVAFALGSLCAAVAHAQVAPVPAPATAPTPAVVVVAPAAPAANWLTRIVSDPNFIAWTFGLVSALYAVAKRSDASAKTKALSAVIVGVEHATQLPAAQAVEKTIKESIQKFAVANGVEPELNALVTQLTGMLPAPALPAPAPVAPPAS